MTWRESRAPGSRWLPWISQAALGLFWPSGPLGLSGRGGAGEVVSAGAGTTNVLLSAPACPPPCSSCFNGGTCVDGINSFTCLCPPGFTGSYCQHDVNECDSQPCLHGGTCQDGCGSYRCTCPQGYTGPNCQVSAPATEVPEGGALGGCLPAGGGNGYPQVPPCRLRVTPTLLGRGLRGSEQPVKESDAGAASIFISVWVSGARAGAQELGGLRKDVPSSKGRGWSGPAEGPEGDPAQAVFHVGAVGSPGTAVSTSVEWVEAQVGVGPLVDVRSELLGKWPGGWAHG